MQQRSVSGDAMIVLLRNPHRGTGIADMPGVDGWKMSSDPSRPLELLRRCPAARATPLRHMPDIAEELHVGTLALKDESARMGLGSFKALGAAYAIACDAVRKAGEGAADEEILKALSGETYASASAGNHGLSLAAGAKLFGAQAVVWLSHNVPEAFEVRLRSRGAKVVRAGNDYEESVAAATEVAAANGWTLLSDSSWPGYCELPVSVMEGYLAMGAEIAEVLDEAPTHVFLQAGVGGLAAALAAYVRSKWGDDPVIAVVEPETAPALLASIGAGKPVKSPGPASCMRRLDCKEPSLLALHELSVSADWFALISDEQAEAAVAVLEICGISTTSSGGAGFAALLCAGKRREELRLTPESRVLAIISEGKIG